MEGKTKQNFTRTFILKLSKGKYIYYITRIKLKKRLEMSPHTLPKQRKKRLQHTIHIDKKKKKGSRKYTLR